MRVQQHVAERIRAGGIRAGRIRAGRIRAGSIRAGRIPVRGGGAKSPDGPDRLRRT